MTVTVKHPFVSTVPDSTDTSLVRPSNWNADHTIVGLGTAAELNAGVANGVATLDSAGTVPISQLPAAVLGALSYQGTWDASSNTPTLTSSVGTKGYYYVVSVAGSTNLNGITDWKVGDWAVYNGTAWQKIDNTDSVTSVNGYTGAVVLTYTDVGAFPATPTTGANSVVLRDANQNVSANAFFSNSTTIAAAGTTTTLVASSITNWNVTGSGGQTFQLPDATTLPVGAAFTFNNNQTSGTIVVKNNSSTTITTVQSGGFVTVYLLANTPAAGTWDTHAEAPTNVSWSTNTFDYAGSITSATWNGATVQVNRGGTGATTLTGYVKGSGTTALTASASIPTTDLSGTITNAQLANSAITINGTAISLGSSTSVGTVTSVTGTAPVVSSGGTTPAISMAAASASANGYLTSADWTTFNSKGSGTVTSVSATSPVTSTGGATPTIAIPAATTSVSGYLTSTDWTTFNNKQPSGAYLTTITVDSPLTGSGTSGSHLAIPAATTSVNGYLTSTDWTTFNGKQNAFGSQTANYVYAAPNGSAGVPSFRAIVANDIPTLNQNTTGTAANVTGIVATANGGTALSTTPTNGQLLIGNGTGYTLSTLTAGTGVTITNASGGITIASSGGSSTSYLRTTQTATAGQVTFTVAYTAPYIEIFLNGVLLNAVDYTATNGTSVVLATAANLGDILDFIAYNATTIGSPAGSNTQVQYNNSGALGASSSFTFTGNDLNIPFGTSGSATPTANIALALAMIA
jgi:hypothetical protein